MVSVPEIFRHKLQGGHIDIGILDPAQMDKLGNINTTEIDECHKSVMVPRSKRMQTGQNEASREFRKRLTGQI
jgi:acyl CoA:acetate/3-ketoacid CoA transferase beta subunit